MNRDLHNNIKVSQTLVPQEAATGTVTTDGIDHRGFDANEHVFEGGATVDLTSVTLQESDDDSTYTDVAVADDQLPAAALTPPGANSVLKVGYVGDKRYSRLSIVINTASDLSAIGVQGEPHEAPVD